LEIVAKTCLVGNLDSQSDSVQITVRSTALTNCSAAGDDVPHQGLLDEMSGGTEQTDAMKISRGVAIPTSLTPKPAS
jgi:hypothetical protein